MILFKSTHERRIQALKEAHEIEVGKAYKRGVIEGVAFVAENNSVIYNKNIGIAASAKFAVDPGDDSSIRDALGQVERAYQ